MFTPAYALQFSIRHQPSLDLRSGYGQAKIGSRNMINLSETWSSSINHMFYHQFNFMIVYDVGGAWVPLWACTSQILGSKLKEIQRLL